MSKRFGFTVERENGGFWNVHLPHKCGEWVISGEDVNRDEAIAELERFITEAQEALAALKRGEEYPPREED